ncbi:MAG: hypothetical protein ABGY75_22270 [Gemmataceae bacterium]
MPRDYDDDRDDRPRRRSRRDDYDDRPPAKSNTGLILLVVGLTVLVLGAGLSIWGYMSVARLR